MEKKPLLSGESYPLILDYVDRDRSRSKRYVLLLGIDEGRTSGGKHRIWLNCRDEDNGNFELKTYLAHRIQEVTSRETGEVTSDVQSFFRHLISEKKGTPPESWPSSDENKLRTHNFDIDFDELGFVIGWSFGVSSAFRKSLDIVFLASSSKQLEREGIEAKKFWAQGLPPSYSFELGDIFYSPKIYCDEPWSVSLSKITNSIQVLEASPDKISKGRLVDGKVKIEICSYENGDVVKRDIEQVTQRKLVDMLRVGIAKN